MQTDDTIFAVASAPPPSLRAVIRLSGPAAWTALASLLERPSDLARPGAVRTSLRLVGQQGPLSVPATLYLFRAPRSYTGEDVVELHIPGSPWIVRTLLETLTSLPGLRTAGPGEFTARAFLSGKLDLTQAEGVAAAVSASDARQHRAAQQLLAGTLASRIRDLTERLAGLLALVEAGIDFSDEDVSFISRADLHDGVSGIRSEVRDLLNAGARFGVIAPHPVVVLVGRPNAGKSTLLNALLGRPRAVVSPLAGTTRDVLFEDLTLPGGTLRLTDVAGLEAEAPGDPAPAAGRGMFAPQPLHPPANALAEIERAMQDRALRAAAEADVLILVQDPSDRAPSPTLPRPPDLTVFTKSDLHTPLHSLSHHLSVSAHTGHGIPILRDRLADLCFGTEGGAGLALTARHTGHLRATDQLLDQTLIALGDGDELVAAGLRHALDELGAITGVISPDDVLGKVFSTFCIGK